MVHGVCDCRGYAGDAYFTDAVPTQGIGVIVRHLHKLYFEVGNISVNRHMIFGKIGIDGSAVPQVHDAFFHQRHADTHDDATINLAYCSLHVENGARIDDCNPAADAHDAEVAVDFHFAEVRSEGVH